MRRVMVAVLTCPWMKGNTHQVDGEGSSCRSTAWVHVPLRPRALSVFIRASHPDDSKQLWIGYPDCFAGLARLRIGFTDFAPCLGPTLDARMHFHLRTD